jgi:hypothetical protein
MKMDYSAVHRLAVSIPWNGFLGFINVYKFGLCCEKNFHTFVNSTVGYVSYDIFKEMEYSGTQLRFKAYL